MSEQERRRRSSDHRSPNAQDEAEPARRGDGHLADDLDDLLDEIDEVLEANAEDFVKSYIQKGGE